MDAMVKDIINGVLMDESSEYGFESWLRLVSFTVIGSLNPGV